MNITINNELLQYIDPLTANEYAALERSLLAEGCRDALVLWGEVLVDGHNRYEICRKHGIEFKIVQNTSFASIDDVMLWMIDNQLGRRSVTDFQRGVLALRKRDIIAARVKSEMDASIESKDASAYEPVGDGAAKPAEDAATPAIPSASIKTREDIARVAGISSNTVGQIEKIRKTAAPELVEAVRAGPFPSTRRRPSPPCPAMNRSTPWPAARKNCARPPRWCANSRLRTARHAHRAHQRKMANRMTARPSPDRAPSAATIPPPCAPKSRH